MLDERWLMTVDFEKATERIIERHVASGVAGSTEVRFLRAVIHVDLPTRGPGSTMEGKRKRHAK